MYYFPFLFSPQGKKFRSKNELIAWYEKKGEEIDASLIDFTVKGASNTPKKTPKKQKTPKAKKSPQKKVRGQSLAGKFSVSQVPEIFLFH